MFNRRSFFTTLLAGAALAGFAATQKADAGELLEMQGTQSPPAPSPMTPGLGNRGMARNGATQRGQARRARWYRRNRRMHRRR
jgi:hypothetical protein